MPEIQYEDFAKLELRIGTVVAAEMVPETTKLIKCTIYFGELGMRTIVSGIAQWKKPEELVGKQLPYIVNLAPKMLRGVFEGLRKELIAQIRMEGVDRAQKLGGKSALHFLSCRRCVNRISHVRESAYRSESCGVRQRAD